MHTTAHYAVMSIDFLLEGTTKEPEGSGGKRGPC